MIRYYTRACNFKYGPTAKQLINSKKALPLCGNKNISFEQLSDFMAFKIITNSTRECYRCLGIIHRKFPYIQGRFKDFISAPKSNGYRALHSSVMGPKNKKI